MALRCQNGKPAASKHRRLNRASRKFLRVKFRPLPLVQGERSKVRGCGTACCFWTDPHPALSLSKGEALNSRGDILLESR
jgi:hypothetical protein